MTEENYKYRTNLLFLRNQFSHAGKYGIPRIPKSEFSREELHDLRLISFDQTKRDGGKHADRAVHFFLYDYKFEKLWENPEPFVDQLKPYRAVLSLDFSMYTEMPLAMLLYNTFRNRWCGAYLASKGLRVIPTVNWGNEDSFDFCFEGIPKGSVVAVSTYMVSEHNNHADQKEYFLKGYEEMLRRIEPEMILCYHQPFPEMKGNIVTISFDSSSWQSLRDEKGFETTDKPAIMVTKAGYVTGCWQEKGSGSAYGGKWQPNPSKPTDSRYIGEPGEIKRTTMPNGDIFETKIGDDQYAATERHWSVHNRPDKHTNPHDHIISWEGPDHHPVLGPPINYFGDVPEFKQFGGGAEMQKGIYAESGDLNFETISEFKRSLSWGAEIEFEWKNVHYGVIRYGTDNKITIYEANKPETEKVCETPDEALEYMVGEDCLRDVITQVNVLARTI